ncbi:hypothetical protein [Paracidovorax citrulli]
MLTIDAGSRFSLPGPDAPSAANVFVFRGSIHVAITWDRDGARATAQRVDRHERSDFPSIVAWLVFRVRSLLRMEGSACWRLNAQDCLQVRALAQQRGSQDTMAVSIGLSADGTGGAGGADAQAPVTEPLPGASDDACAINACAAQSAQQLGEAASKGGLAYLEAFGVLLGQIEGALHRRPQLAAMLVATALDSGRLQCEAWSAKTLQEADEAWVRLFQLASRVPPVHRFPIALALIKADKRGDAWPAECGAAMGPLRVTPDSPMLDRAQQLARLTGDARHCALDCILDFCRSHGKLPASCRADLILLSVQLLGREALRKDQQACAQIADAALHLARAGQPKALLELGWLIDNGTVAAAVELMCQQPADACASWMAAWLANSLLDPLHRKEAAARIALLMQLLEPKGPGLPLDVKTTLAHALAKRLAELVRKASPLLGRVNLPADFFLLERSLPAEGADTARRTLEELKQLWADPSSPSGKASRASAPAQY